MFFATVLHFTAWMQVLKTGIGHFSCLTLYMQLTSHLAEGTLRFSGKHSCFIFRTPWIRDSSRRQVPWLMFIVVFLTRSRKILG